jgi:hypothetical protein
MKQEGDSRAAFHNRTRLHIAPYTKALTLRLLAHFFEFRDGFVVRFRVLNTAKRKPHKGSNNQYHQGPELHVRIHM